MPSGNKQLRRRLPLPMAHPEEPSKAEKNTYTWARRGLCQGQLAEQTQSAAAPWGGEKGVGQRKEVRCVGGAVD